ncbi:MAG: PD-(D/E)XK nuclease-like domain-containing protein [Phycisphaerales bacterium]|nr:PD-(D/E)XK nuclease-like domain-containing protein [Phycisphaerales bacterium]
MISENDKYHADTSRISKSGLDLIHKAPAKYYERYLNQNRASEKRTEYFVEGSAFHTIILEPELFKNEFVVHLPFKGEGSRKQKERLISMNPGKDLILMETYNTVNYMRDAVMNHPIAGELFNDGFAERVFNWIDPATGVKCKCKPDWFNTKRKCTVDLKSTDDASNSSFVRSSFKYRYHVQSPFYIDGLKNNGINSDSFIFVAVEKEPPYLVNVFYSPKDSMDFGREEYLNDLEIYKECKLNNEWPGYGDTITPLELPGWMK